MSTVSAHLEGHAGGYVCSSQTKQVLSLFITVCRKFEVDETVLINTNGILINLWLKNTIQTSKKTVSRIIITISLPI